MPEGMTTTGGAGPIAVDLDGTLLRSDTLHESLVQLLLRRPWMLPALILRLFAGKAAFKRFVAARARIDARSIPAHPELLAYLVEQKGHGRRIGLFSAADESLVAAVAQHFGIFDVAVGSDGTRNLSGAAKLAAIRERLGDDFVYAGDARVDVPIWRESSAAILVGRTGSLRARIGAQVPVEREFPATPASARTWIRALRLHQWAKNGLVFVPAVLSIPILTLLQAAHFLLAFAALGCAASATYLINDLTDLAADRAHRSKRYRPLASCALPLSHAVVAILLLAAGTAGLAAFLPRFFLAPLLLYVGTTLAYSFWIKRVPVFDVLCLGTLFTLRVAAGTVLIPGAPPYWLFAFSMFFFTSLALVKRYTELLSAGADEKALSGRGYRYGDLGFVLSVGVATAVASLVVLLIYLGEQHFNRALFAQPLWLGLAGLVLAHWLLRIWLLAVRDEMHEDPVLFALTDKTSYTMAAVIAAALIQAW